MSYMPTFEITIDTTLRRVEQYRQTSFKVYVSSLYGYSKPVTLSCEIISGSLTWNGSFSFQTNPVTPPTYTVLSVLPSSSTPSKYTVRLYGQDGTITKYIDFCVEVIEAKDFELGISVRTSQFKPRNYLAVKKTITYTLTVYLFPVNIQSYPNNVSLSYSLLHSEPSLQISFDPSTIDSGFTVDSPAQSIMSVYTPTDLNNQENILSVIAYDSVAQNYAIAKISLYRIIEII